MGSPKQLLRVGGRSLVERAVRAARACRTHGVFVVLGAAEPEVAAELAGLDVELLSNPEWPSGLASSIRCGIQAVASARQADAGGFDAALLLLADQPEVGPELLDELIATFDESDAADAGIVACEYAGTLGAPAVFGRRHFALLCELSGDAGARSLLADCGPELRRVAFEPAAVDIDTPDDYASLIARASPDYS
jgi:CTP:molybdopterin cytidylyltransferase MocA